MAMPYSDDLRLKLLDAYEAGAGSLRSLAAQFRVSWGYSKKIRRQQLHSGDKRRPVQQRHGPASRITSQAQEQVRDWVREQPDLTAAELCARLGGIGVAVSRSRMGRLLRQIGLRRKKNPSTRRSGTRGPTASNGKSSSRPSLPSPQRS